MSEWWAYYQIEPFGVERDDLRIGQLIAFIGNIFKQKNAKSFQPADFVLRFTKDQKKQSAESMLAIAEQLNAAFGGKDLRGKRGPKASR